MKKIILVGPFSSSGGREIEGQIIAKSLIDNFQVELISTIYLTKKSEALIHHKNFTWTTVQKQIFKSNVVFFLSSILVKITNRRSEFPYNFVKNKLTKKLYDYDERADFFFEKLLQNCDGIFFTGEIVSTWYARVLQIAGKKNIPTIVRTTSTITSAMSSMDLQLRTTDKILVHSIRNFNQLLPNFSSSLEIIDQTSLLEKDLLGIKINTTNSLVFGYLGRFSAEKGILELLELFQSLDEKLFIAGSGPISKRVNDIVNNSPNISNQGKLKGKEVVEFYKNIDVLIIPSLEEAGPLVGVEAMAAGNLIISTRVGAMEDRLEGTSNNFWFYINEEDSLIETVNQLKALDPLAILAIKEELRSKYLKKYSNMVIMKQYSDQIAKLLN